MQVRNPRECDVECLKFIIMKNLLECGYILLKMLKMAKWYERTCCL
jgi:hypothetical protein